jgi:hypothetical protein
MTVTGARGQLLFAVGAQNPDEARRAAIAGRRAELHEIVEFAELLLGYRSIGPAVASAGHPE